MSDTIPFSAQIAVVNKMVLPLLDKMNIGVTVTNRPSGMRLDLTFIEDEPKSDVPLIGTDDPNTARQMWALRDKIEQYKREHPNAEYAD